MQKNYIWINIFFYTLILTIFYRKCQWHIPLLKNNLENQYLNIDRFFLAFRYTFDLVDIKLLETDVV